MLSENKTKDKILKASLKMLNEGGYGSLTISEVARQAELSKQNLFYHYSNMEDIFYDLIVQWSRTGQACTLEALANCPEAGARRVLGVVQGMFLWIRRFPELSRLGLVMFQTGTKIKKTKNFIDSARDVGRERLTSILRADPAFKRTKPQQLDEVISALHAMMYGSFLYVLAMDDFANLDIHEKHCCQNIIRILETSQGSR
ncbi:MAG: TetR/AcrR family transcriptional regulator [Pseudobdellovibrionaceae bacterium]